MSQDFLNIIRADADLVFTDHGEDSDYTQYGHAPVTIQGVWDDENKNIILSMGEIGSSGPQVLVKDSDIPGVTKLATIKRNGPGVTYKITDINPDGMGLTILVLTKS